MLIFAFCQEVKGTKKRKSKLGEKINLHRKKKKKKKRREKKKMQRHN